MQTFVEIVFWVFVSPEANVKVNKASEETTHNKVRNTWWEYCCQQPDLRGQYCTTALGVVHWSNKAGLCLCCRWQLCQIQTVPMTFSLLPLQCTCRTIFMPNKFGTLVYASAWFLSVDPLLLLMNWTSNLGGCEVGGKKIIRAGWQFKRLCKYDSQLTSTNLLEYSTSINSPDLFPSWAITQ